MGSLSQLGGFFQLWNPVLFLVIVVIGLLYARLAGSWRGSFTDSEPISNGKKLSFYTGLLLFYIGQGSPINFIGHHYLFSFHMLQQTILYLTVPIFIWSGLPAWMLRPVVRNKAIYGLLSFFSRPLIAIFLFNILFSIYHMPFIMDGLMRNEWLHLAYHTILLASGFMMWFPVFCPLPELNRLSELKKIAYIFGNGVLLTPACALIIFADSLLYETYRNAVVPFVYLSPIEDQQLGGVIMKIIQEIVYGSVLAIIFFRWYRSERSSEKDEYPDGMDHHESMNTPPSNLNRA
jgi:putative membrane protein